MVSVIVPIYNIEKYLGECIESILGQTYPLYELILVDDGSTDSSGTIADEYVRLDSRIKVIHKQNGGLTSARNAGLKVAQGEWIMHVDGDDWIEPDMIQELLSEAKKSGADIVFGDSYKDGPSSTVIRIPDWDDKVAGMKQYIASVWTCVWGCIAKRSLYNEYGLASPSEICYCEDFHLMMRLCHYANKISNVHRVLYHYRYRPSSIIATFNKKNEGEEQWAVQDIIRFFKRENEYGTYRRELNWRALKSAQELLLDSKEHGRFLELCADGKDDIWSCPFVNKKIKLMAWLITHRMRFLVVVFDKLRVLLRR